VVEIPFIRISNLNKNTHCWGDYSKTPRDVFWITLKELNLDNQNKFVVLNSILLNITSKTIMKTHRLS